MESTTNNAGASPAVKIPSRLLFSLLAVVVIIIIAIAGFFAFRSFQEDKDSGPRVESVNLLDERIANKALEYEREWDQQDMEMALALSRFPRQTIVSRLNTDAPRLNTGRLLMTINGEEFYTDDLNYYIYLTEPAAYLLGGELNVEIINLALDRLFEDHMIFELALDKEIVTSEDLQGIYGGKSKDFFARSTKIEEVRTELDRSTNAEYKAEKVQIWFYNTQIPDMGLEEAKRLTRTKIEAIYSRVKSGEISMKEAGDIVKADTSLAEIDPAYTSNAYSNLIIRDFGFEGVTDPEFREYIKSLDKDELSDIKTVKDQDSKGWYEAAYAFVKITDKTVTGAEMSYKDIIDEQEKDNIILLSL